MLLPAMAALASLVASASTGPEIELSLACTGTQTSYQDDHKAQLSLPWQRTYTVYLKAKRYCDARCGRNGALYVGDGSQLVFGDIAYGPKSTRLTYKDADQSFFGHQIISFAGGHEVHLVTSGTCTLATPNG